jgi:hypothetical protein
MAFLSRRVLPLQRRTHKICQMSGRMDPTRITTHRLSTSDLVLKARRICQNALRPSGKYGFAPYSRSNSPPRQVRPRDLRKILYRKTCGLFLILTCFLCCRTSAGSVRRSLLLTPPTGVSWTIAIRTPI